MLLLSFTGREVVDRLEVREEEVAQRKQRVHHHLDRRASAPVSTSQRRGQHRGQHRCQDGVGTGVRMGSAPDTKHEQRAHRPPEPASTAHSVFWKLSHVVRVVAPSPQWPRRASMCNQKQPTTPGIATCPSSNRHERGHLRGSVARGVLAGWGGRTYGDGEHGAVVGGHAHCLALAVDHILLLRHTVLPVVHLLVEVPCVVIRDSPFIILSSRLKTRIQHILVAGH